MLSMNENDKKCFRFDASDIDWIEFLRTYVLGVRKFIFKEDPKTIESCKKRLFKLKILHQTMKLLTMFFLLWIFWRIFDVRSAVTRFSSMIN